VRRKRNLRRIVEKNGVQILLIKNQEAQMAKDADQEAQNN
jgi:hypothetical protein